MGAIPKMWRSAKEKVVTAALCGDGGLLLPEYSTHQLACTAIATPKLCLRPSTDKHTTCWRRAGLKGEQRSETGLSVSEVSAQIRSDKPTSLHDLCGVCGRRWTAHHGWSLGSFPGSPPTGLRSKFSELPSTPSPSSPSAWIHRCRPEIFTGCLFKTMNNLA